MNLTPEQIDELEKLAGLGYTFKQIALYFNFDYNDVIREYADTNSVFRHHYDRGLLISNALIDMKNLELAKTGNLTASAIIAKKLKDSKFQTIKDRIFNGKY
jgi:hypothetical protein